MLRLARDARSTAICLGLATNEDTPSPHRPTCCSFPWLHKVSDGGIERQDPAGDAGDAGGSDGDDGYGHGAGESDSFSEEQEPGEGGDEEGEEEEEEEEEGERVQEGHAEEGEGGGSSQDVGEEGGSGAALSEKRRPVAPLFSFPPGPRVDRTEAEESLQVSRILGR